MDIDVITVTTGTVSLKTKSLSWMHRAPETGEMDCLIAGIGFVDAQRPDILSVTYSGTPMSMLASTVGPGGSSFPYGYIFYLASPAHVSGTIDVTFDEYVTTTNGFSVGLAGVSGTVFTGYGGLASHTQYPDFDISLGISSPASGILLDLCMSQSSNHNEHVVGSGQSPIAEVFFNGPKISASWRVVSSGVEYTMSRLQAGGPHAGVSLTAVFLPA